MVSYGFTKQTLNFWNLWLNVLVQKVYQSTNIHIWNTTDISKWLKTLSIPNFSKSKKWGISGWQLKVFLLCYNKKIFIAVWAVLHTGHRRQSMILGLLSILIHSESNLVYPMTWVISCLFLENDKHKICMWVKLTKFFFWDRLDKCSTCPSGCPP